MVRHSIPTAGYAAFDDPATAHAHVDALARPCVVKADGLAAGKGVAMCPTVADAHVAIDEMMSARRFGDAGRRVVIEEWLQGEEVSYYAITDGTRIVTLAAAQDHKRVGDGDQGENTGGMGAYSPAPVVTEAVEKKILERVVHPAIRGMAREGHPYQGVLFVGLMIDAAGDPYVIEFNVRFGDPETQPLMVRMQSDLLPVLAAAARGELAEETSIAWGEAAVCVVLASGGYPRDYETGKRISGLDDLGPDAGAGDLVVFHAGTRRPADGIGFETAGGRVLGVTARGDSVAEACDRAYRAVAKIGFEGRHFRRDIAARALRR
jgi:phosphoribosylamine--glycine ligase